MHILQRTLLITLFYLLTACGNEADTQLSPPKKEASVEVDDDVIATIDDKTFHQKQLDRLVKDMFGEYRASKMDAASRKNALDSMLASYALSKKAQAHLSDNKLDIIEDKTRRYRENLLISTYIQTKMDSSAINSRTIKTYYENNLDKFGQERIREYELLTMQEQLTEELRDKFLNIVAKLKNSDGLLSIKKALEKNNFKVQLHKGSLDKKSIDSRLYVFINTQVINKISELTFFDNKPYLVVIISEEMTTPKPLAEVKNNIRKILIMQQLKKTIKEHASTALATSNVVYHGR